MSDDGLNLDLMQYGDLNLTGRLVDASNASFVGLIEIRDHADNSPALQVVYKPIAGERPLWDFPDGNLAQREIAAYYLSEISTWNLVPLTILRDGPAGIGIVQKWIDVDVNAQVVERATADTEEMQKFALFDAIINNTDRKFGHLLIDSQNKMWGCDHGVCFHEEDKLRTVIWQFAGEKISDQLLKDVKNLSSLIDNSYLEKLLTVKEIKALHNRINLLVENGYFPHPNPDWPSIPWPPF